MATPKIRIPLSSGLLSGSPVPSWNCLLQGQTAEVSIPEEVWKRASRALAAGAATLTPLAATAALQQVFLPS